jgi:hypothetical protein
VCFLFQPKVQALVLDAGIKKANFDCPVSDRVVPPHQLVEPLCSDNTLTSGIDNRTMIVRGWFTVDRHSGNGSDYDQVPHALQKHRTSRYTSRRTLQFTGM